MYHIGVTLCFPPLQRHRPLKSRVYNPGELAEELARFESGTSSKFHPPLPILSVLHPKPLPTNLNAHLAVGLSREKEMPEQDAAIQLNLARSRQEVKRQNNKLHPVTFQNKTLRVDISTHREASCLPYCAVRGSNRNWWGLPDGGAKPDQSRNAADHIQWKLGRLISHSHG